MINEREVIKFQRGFEVKRGDIFYAKLEGVGSVQRNVRPVVCVGNDLSNKYSPVISVVPLTSKLAKTKLPTHVYLSVAESGLKEGSICLGEQVISIDRRLQICEGGYVSTLSDEIMKKIDKAVMIQLGLIKIHKKKEINLEYVKELKEDIEYYEEDFIRCQKERNRKSLIMAIKELKNYLEEHGEKPEDYIDIKYNRLLQSDIKTREMKLTAM